LIGRVPARTELIEKGARQDPGALSISAHLLGPPLWCSQSLAVYNTCARIEFSGEPRNSSHLSFRLHQPSSPWMRIGIHSPEGQSPLATAIGRCVARYAARRVKRVRFQRLTSHCPCAKSGGCRTGRAGVP
jgi:hypothetical protein